MKTCRFCGKEEIFRLNTQQFIAFDGGVRKEGSGGPICPEHLIEKLREMHNAHHFIYRVDAPYQPDGANYDDLLRMSVEDCAKYRRQSVAEFMRIGGGELIRSTFQFYRKRLRTEWKRFWWRLKYR